MLRRGGRRKRGGGQRRECSSAAGPGCSAGCQVSQDRPPSPQPRDEESSPIPDGGGGGDTFPFFHDGRGNWACRSCRAASFPCSAPHAEWTAFAARHTRVCRGGPRPPPEAPRRPADGDGGGVDGGGGGGGSGGRARGRQHRGRGSGRDDSRGSRRQNSGAVTAAGEGVAAAAGEAAAAGAGAAAGAALTEEPKKKKAKKKKPTSFRRLVRPKSARFLFQTPTPEEERDQIAEAPWCDVDASALEFLTADRPIHRVTAPEQVGPAAAKLRASRSSFLGIDCEWRSLFEKGASYDKIDVLQLASEEDVFVFHLSALLGGAGGRAPPSGAVADALAPLRDLMADPSIVKGGQDPRSEMLRLERTLGWPEGTVRAVLCTQYLSGLFHPSSLGLSALVALFLDRRMSKPRKVQMSNWARMSLTEQQVRYAAMDAVASRGVMVAMLEAVRKREGLPSLRDVVEKTRSLTDSVIPEEFAGVDHGKCASCGDRTSLLLKKFGLHWGIHILFERCLRDSTDGKVGGKLPPASSFQPRQVGIERPSEELLARVYLPHRLRDIFYTLPSPYTGKHIKAKTLFYMAVEKALHRTGTSIGVCDLRLDELVSAGGPKAVNGALKAAGYSVTYKREKGRHVATCSKSDKRGIPIMLELVGTNKEHALGFFKLMLIRYLQLADASRVTS